MTVTETRTTAVHAPQDSPGLTSPSESTLSVAEVATLTGLSGHTLRYYERTGLMLRPIDRAASQQRRYSPADVTWIRFLTKLRSTAMPIATIRDYVELARRGDSTSAQRLELLQRHRADVLTQLQEVTDSLAAIEFKIATYQNSLTGQTRNDQS